MFPKPAPSHKKLDKYKVRQHASPFCNQLTFFESQPQHSLHEHVAHCCYCPNTESTIQLSMDQVESLTAQVKKENRKYFRKVCVVKNIIFAAFKLIRLKSMSTHKRSKSQQLMLWQFYMEQNDLIDDVHEVSSLEPPNHGSYVSTPACRRMQMLTIASPACSRLPLTKRKLHSYSPTHFSILECRRQSSFSLSYSRLCSPPHSCLKLTPSPLFLDFARVVGLQRRAYNPQSRYCHADG